MCLNIYVILNITFINAIFIVLGNCKWDLENIIWI